MKENTRAKDFRYIYSNGIKLQFSQNEVMLFFGIKEDPTSQEDSLFEQVSVVMSPASAKLLAVTLTRTIEHFESSTHVQIPVDQAKLEYLERILEAVGSPVKASPTASPPPSGQSAPAAQA